MSWTEFRNPNIKTVYIRKGNVVFEETPKTSKTLEFRTIG